jgi:hypothetical protein
MVYYVLISVDDGSPTLSTAAQSLILDLVMPPIDTSKLENMIPL